MIEFSVFPVNMYSPEKNHQGQARVKKGEFCRQS
jgi:hypothetical protein